MTNNAVIFFTSASVARRHGGRGPEFSSSNVSTNDLRVPMMKLNWPGRIPARRESSGFEMVAAGFSPDGGGNPFVHPAPEAEGISVAAQYWSANRRQTNNIVPDRLKK